MSQGNTVWVRDPLRSDNKKEVVLEFEKGDEIIVSYPGFDGLCVFNKSQIVDPPSDFELEVQETNYIISSIYDKARSEDWNFHRLLDEMGFKLIRMNCREYPDNKEGRDESIHSSE